MDCEQATGRNRHPLEHVIFGPDWPGAAAWKEKWRTMTAQNLLGAFDTLARRDDIDDKVSAIRVPMLLIHGDADAPIPLAKAQAMQALFLMRSWWSRVVTAST